MGLMGMRGVSWGFADPPLLDNIDCRIHSGERIGLVGRNGVGKSTLLRLLAGRLAPDSGEVWRRRGTTVAMLDQEVPANRTGTLIEVVAEECGPVGRALARYHRVCTELNAAGGPDAERERTRAALQQTLEAAGGWDLLQRIECTLSRNGLNAAAAFTDLSAGMQRRTLLARAVVSAPDVLLLDEPTNHLDIEAILALETLLVQEVKTVLFVTHDRVFLQRIANRILELDRGRLLAFDADYRTYLARRQSLAAAEEKQEAAFDRRLSREEAWIRRGIKARRTRNEGRVRALHQMRAAYRARRRETGPVRLRLQEVERSGRLVVEAVSLRVAHDPAAPLIDEFSTLIMRGDRVGLMGPNGAGKTTLLRVLLGQLSPQAGRIRLGTGLQVAHFDQLRHQLDEQRTVGQNIGGGNDYIVFNGRRRHVVGYLQDFLFAPDRVRTPVHVLSGGEKNRLLLAKLFTLPANVLVLDEPTNDLDVDTLQLLEELLLEFTGTLLLVSHDRAFINNVVTSTIVFEGQGRVTEYAGGYDDWLAQRPAPSTPAAPPKPPTGAHRAPPAPRRPKLGFNENRELADLPQRIERLEAEQRQLFDDVADPAFYRRDKAQITAVTRRLAALEQAIAAAYERWERLEELAGTG